MNAMSRCDLFGARGWRIRRPDAICYLALALLCAASAQAGPSLDWTRQYNGLGAFPSDQVRDLLTDPEGNVYLTGSSEDANGRQIAATLKYGPDGGLIWQDRYAGPSFGGPEIGRAMALSASGDLFVAGERGVDGANFPGPDIFVARYSPSGARLWVVAYDGPGHDFDTVGDIVVDTNGNVYVTGTSEGTTATGNDIVTLRVSPEGVINWAARFDGPAHWTDAGLDLALDNQGHVVVTGSVAVNTLFDTDIIVLSYDLSGNLAWSRQAGAALNRGDSGRSIACNAAGDIYVGGWYEATANNLNYVTLKYDNVGTLGWLVQYSSPGNGSDQTRELRLAPDGGIVITGTAVGGSLGVAVVTLAYHPTGVLRWTNVGAGLEYSSLTHRALAFDAQSNVYVLAFDTVVNGVNDFSMHPMRLNGATGVTEWQIDFGLGTQLEDYPVALAVGSDNAVYLTGLSHHQGMASHWDYTTTRYTQSSPAAVGSADLPRGPELGIGPNPFRDAARVSLSLPREDRARVTLVDATGRELRLLLDERMAAGPHSIALDASGLPSGVYFARLAVGGEVITSRVVHLR